MKLRLKSIFPSRDLGWNRVRAMCAHPECHNKLLMRAVPGSRHGLFVGEQWYCSPDCFSVASRAILISLSAAEVVEVPRNPRLSLGLALLTRGFLTTEQFRYAMARNEIEGADLETAVAELGWITEKQLAVARSAQWGYPVLGQDLSAHSVIADLPPILFRACSATPLYYSRENARLVLGFVRQVDHSLLQAIEHVTRCRAEPCFITRGELGRQLDRLIGPPRYQQVLDEQAGNPLQMARTLGAFAVQLAATEAVFARCHSFLWARLAGNKGTADILFDLKNVESASPAAHFSDVAEITPGLRDRVFAKRANRAR